MPVRLARHIEYCNECKKPLGEDRFFRTTCKKCEADMQSKLQAVATGACVILGIGALTVIVLLWSNLTALFK